MMKRIFTLCAIVLGFCLSSFAQTITVEKPIVAHPTQEKYKAVEVSDTIHAVEGSSAVYRIIVEGYDSIASVTSLSYNEINIESGWKLDKGVLTIDDITISDLEANKTVDFKVTLIVREKGKDTDTERSDTAMSIKVWEEPIATQDVESNSEDNPEKMFLGDSWNLAVSTTGGFTEGWKIEWRDASNGKVLSESEKFELRPTITNMIDSKHVKLHVTNYTPEDQSIWYEDSCDYYIRFYPIPKVQFADSYPSDVKDGDDIPMKVILLADEKLEDDYSVSCNWGANSDNSDVTYQFKAENGKDEKGVERIVNVTCTIGLEGTDVKKDTTLSHTFVVWPQPSVTLSDPTNASDAPKLLFQEGQWNISINSFGGYREGWKYAWEDESGNILEGREYAMKCDNASDNVEARHVILTVTNKNPNPGGADWFNETYTFYAEFYPTPIVKFEKELFNVIDGKTITLIPLVLDTKGNSVENAYDLSYSWNNGESTSPSYDFLGVNTDNNDGAENTIAVDGTLTLKGTNLTKNYQLSADIVVWPQPVVDATGIFDREGCGGQSITYSVIANGGKKDGWSYVWTQNNQVLDETTSTLIVDLDNAPDEGSVVNVYKIKVVNTCDGDTWYNDSIPFNLTIYPTPKIPEEIVIKDINRDEGVTTGIREGNEIILHCDECTGGYPNGWSYRWMRNNTGLGNQNELNDKVVSGYGGSGKANDLLIEYTCSVGNTYKAVPWMQKEYKKEIRVYRKPQTPTSLRKKGNGTSGTLIATCGIDDASLSTNDYYLVFGYRDADGVMHDVSSMSQQNAGEQRWSTSMNSSGYADGRNNAYVYALWKYSDGAEVTSGLCLESHIEEDWDGSTYNGETRSVIADATDVGVLPSSPDGSEGCVYYTIDGQKSVRAKKGLNIIRRNDGQYIKYINNR